MSTANQGILLVCMGNICRSPTAEAILRAQLRARGLDTMCRWTLPAPMLITRAKPRTHAHARRHRH